MAEAVYVSEGEAIDYTPSGSSLVAGQVVDLGTFVGVAVTDIADGVKGALAIEGVFDFAKYTGEAVTLGQLVYWDEGTNTATTTVGYSEAVIGKAVAAALAGDSTVRVKLIPNIS
jgi:predicted RecA/RadA family phage recombinase